MGAEAYIYSIVKSQGIGSACQETSCESLLLDTLIAALPPRTLEASWKVSQGIDSLR